MSLLRYSKIDLTWHGESIREWIKYHRVWFNGDRSDNNLQFTTCKCRHHRRTQPESLVLHFADATRERKIVGK